MIFRVGDRVKYKGLREDQYFYVPKGARATVREIHTLNITCEFDQSHPHAVSRYGGHNNSWRTDAKCWELLNEALTPLQVSVQEWIDEEMKAIRA